MFRMIRERVTYANVAATLALFVALGGTSYAALALPRNSVGSRQLKSRSVGNSEVRKSAVDSRTIRDRGIALRDISRSARRSLRGAAGPAGPPGAPGTSLFAVVNSAGRLVSGNATSSEQRGVNGWVLSFGRSVSGCAYAASLAHVDGGAVSEAPRGSNILVGPADNGRVLVRTWEGTTERSLPFHLIVAC